MEKMVSLFSHRIQKRRIELDCQVSVNLWELKNMVKLWTLLFIAVRTKYVYCDTFHLFYFPGLYFAMNQWLRVDIYLFIHDVVECRTHFSISHLCKHESLLNLLDLNGLISAATDCKFTVCTIHYCKCIWNMKAEKRLVLYYGSYSYIIPQIG
jgi:hypothetical protein